MKKKESKQKKNDELRKKAEKKLKTDTIPIEKLSDTDVRKLAHELLIHQIELEMQNEELRKAQVELEESRNEFSNLYDFAPVGYLTIDEEGVILEANLTIAEMLATERSSLINSLFHHSIIMEDQDVFYLHLKKVFAGKEQKHACEIRLCGKDDTTFYARLDSVLPRETDGNNICRTSVADITQRKRAETQIKVSLKEKEVLLKEIHHRVKNNMQIMASLLRLQSEEIEDEHLLELFKESQNRIKSMALIHEDLYSGKDLARIDFDQYTRKLTGRLISAYGVDPNRIITSVNIDNVFLGVDTAIPCGLILNELFTNSLKYAFPLDKFGVNLKEERGEIRIDCRSNSGEYTLIFSDNGVGLPEDIDFQKTETLGLDLVRTLVEQLKGTIELNRSGGTEFAIIFGV